MTNELAIRILTGDVLGTSEQTQEAVKTAVKALSQPDVPDTNVGDMISRHAAINLLKKWSDGYKYIETETELAIKDFQHLPSVQPERKRGKWVDYVSHCECSVCHTEWGYIQNETECFEFCPNCGARMENNDERFNQ